MPHSMAAAEHALHHYYEPSASSRPWQTSVGLIHDRMPAILRPEDYRRWLAADPDGPNLLQPFPSEPMAIWPISTRVNSTKNEDATLLEPLADSDACWPSDGNSA